MLALLLLLLAAVPVRAQADRFGLPVCSAPDRELAVKSAFFVCHSGSFKAPLWTLETGTTIRISPGDHSELIKAIIEDFAPRFVPGGVLVYAGDTGEKWGYFDKELLVNLGVVLDGHGKMPDVVLQYPDRDWLLLAEAVTSHGPVDGKRHDELAILFGLAGRRPGSFT